MAGMYERIAKNFASTPIGAWFFINCTSVLDRYLIHWTKGKLSAAVGTNMHAHAVLLYTKGARTGKERVVPLTAAFDGENVVLVASRGGHENNPAWYHNLKANPRCAVERAGERTERVAHEAQGEERIPLWNLAKEIYEGYQTYQDRTTREIPIMVLRPVR